MASRFSDIFNNDSSSSNDRGEAHIDQDGSADGNASNDGINVTSESWNQDEDGNTSYDSNSVDTGSTDLGGSLDVGNMVDGLTHNMNTSDGTDILDN